MADTPPSTPAAEVPDDLPALLHAAGRGDERAWRRIIDLYARRVYALARSRLGAGRHELAEEITQSVFATVAAKLGQHTNDGPEDEGAPGGAKGYAEQGKFESWLFRIAMNRIRDEVRRSRRQAEPADPATFNLIAGDEESDAAGMGAGRGGAGGAGSMDSAERLHSLRHAMEKLSDADREIVELRHHAGLSFKQMADLLSEPIGTLLARHHRALKKLKDMLSGEQFGTGRTT